MKSLRKEKWKTKWGKELEPSKNSKERNLLEIFAKVVYASGEFVKGFLG